jgi:hypothetical protein
MTIRRLMVAVITIFLTCCLLALPEGAFAQSAKEAVMALKKLEARVQAGISYRDYGPALGEAKFPINLFMESADAKNHPELTEAFNKTMKHYEYAGSLWNLKVSNIPIPFFVVESDIGKEVKNKYPQAPSKMPGHSKFDKETYYVSELLPFIWAEASNELKQASSLLVQETTRANDEMETLKKTNQELTVENMKLKEEIADLKKRLASKRK